MPPRPSVFDQYYAWQQNPNNAFPNALPPVGAQTYPAGMPAPEQGPPMPPKPGSVPQGNGGVVPGATPAPQLPPGAGPASQAAGAALGNELASGSPFSFGQPPSAPVLAGTPTANAGLPNFSMGYGPEQYLADDMQLPGQIGAAGPTYTAEQVASVGSSPLIPPGVMTYAGPVAAAGLGAATAAAAYNANNAAQNSSKNPVTGLKEGIKAAGPLNFVPVLGQAAWLAGAAGAMFGSGKDKEQVGRDGIRKKLVGIGFLNPDYTYTLPDGTAFDFGKDGNARLQNQGTDPLSGQDWRHHYDVDWSDPSNAGIVAAVNPLAAFFADGDKKLTRDFAGMLTNAAKSGGDPMENVMNFYDKAKMGHDQIYGAIHLLSKSQGGPLDDKVADAYKSGVDELYGVGAFEGQGPKFSPNAPQPQVKQADRHDDEETAPSPSPRASTPPQGVAGNAQQPVQPRGTGSPFVGSPNNAAATGLIGSKQRISPGVWKDAKGTYNSKTGVRGQ